MKFLEKPIFPIRFSFDLLFFLFCLDFIKLSILHINSEIIVKITRTIIKLIVLYVYKINPINPSIHKIEEV
jgi:hypothetical protein